MAQFELK